MKYNNSIWPKRLFIIYYHFVFIIIFKIICVRFSSLKNTSILKWLIKTIISRVRWIVHCGETLGFRPRPGHVTAVVVKTSGILRAPWISRLFSFHFKKPKWSRTVTESSACKGKQQNRFIIKLLLLLLYL